MLSLFAFVVLRKENFRFSSFLLEFFISFSVFGTRRIYIRLSSRRTKNFPQTPAGGSSLWAQPQTKHFFKSSKGEAYASPFLRCVKKLRMKTCGFLHFIDMFRLLSPFARSAVPMYGDVRTNEDFRSKPEEPRRADPPFGHSSCASHYGGGGTSLASDGEGGTSRRQKPLSVTFGDSSPKGRAFLIISER